MTHPRHFFTTMKLPTIHRAAARWHRAKRAATRMRLARFASAYTEAARARQESATVAVLRESKSRGALGFTSSTG